MKRKKSEGKKENKINLQRNILKKSSRNNAHATAEL